MKNEVYIIDNRGVKELAKAKMLISVVIGVNVLLWVLSLRIVLRISKHLADTAVVCGLCLSMWKAIEMCVYVYIPSHIVVYLCCYLYLRKIKIINGSPAEFVGEMA